MQSAAVDTHPTPSLGDVAPGLARILKRSLILTEPRFGVADITVQTVMVSMRDGTNLATDIYLPPGGPAPTVLVRTPYHRDADALAAVLLNLARRGYAVASQDCRGTGQSEPDSWDYYMYESEDGYDFVAWVCRQAWCDGFIASCGGSYVAQTQWQMAQHPRMSTIVPDVSGLGVAVNTGRFHMFLNAYARSVGKGEEKCDVPYFELEGRMLNETLATGLFNEPLHRPFSKALLERFPMVRAMSPTAAQRWLWEKYCVLGCRERVQLVKEALSTETVTMVDVEALSAVFGQEISHDRHTLPHSRPAELVRTFRVPVLLRTGWYDWGLNDALATWKLFREEALEPVRSLCRLFVAPCAHNMPGYHEGMAEHPELHHATSTNFEMLLRWYAAVRSNAIDSWPRVIYYLMGANEWRAASDWPIPQARVVSFYLGDWGRLTEHAPQHAGKHDEYTYDPEHPTPTVGGSIVSYVYPPGSVDVSNAQQRRDVLTYTSDVLAEDLDVIGPLRMILYASSSAEDTDFVARLSDVFPDGRAIQLQNGLLRARYRDPDKGPQLLEPGEIYRLEIDMWATANRFKAGHRLRLDISSADFPRYDRNSNRGGEAGGPLAAVQSIYRDRQNPSHLLISIVDVN
jgi:predicted acyl esterase